MTPLATVMTTVGVVVAMIIATPFARAPECDQHTSGSPRCSYALYALVGVHLAVLAIGVTVAGAATFIA